MPYLLKYPDYDIYIGDIVLDKKGRCRCYCSNSPKKNAHRFRTAKAAEKFRKDNGLTEREVVYEKPVPKNRPFTYKVLMEQAEERYKSMAVDSPFCAECELRDFIASKIDECVDANTNKKALKVREWEEYQPYAPMKRKDYEERKRQLKKQLKADLAELEKEWNTRGKHNPNFHKI
jgi:hypothetical protein